MMRIKRCHHCQAESAPSCKRRVRVFVRVGGARGEATPPSDIDIAVKLDPARTPRGVSYIGFVDAIQARLEALLEGAVNVVPEPANKQRLQEQIDKDRAVAF